MYVNIYVNEKTKIENHNTSSTKFVLDYLAGITWISGSPAIQLQYLYKQLLFKLINAISCEQYVLIDIS